MTDIYTNMSTGTLWVQVAADHEYSFERDSAVYKAKYGVLPIMLDRGYDFSNKFGMFCKYGVPIENYLGAHPEERTSLMKQARVIKAGTAWQAKFGVVEQPTRYVYRIPSRNQGVVEDE